MDKNFASLFYAFLDPDIVGSVIQKDKIMKRGLNEYILGAEELRA
jgi:hypothetical protein